MSFSDLRLAIIDRFATAWAGETPVEYEGVPFSAPQNDAYARVLVRDGARVPADIAATVLRCEGFLVVDLFAPQSGGTARLRALADMVAEIFDFQHLSSPGLREIEFGATSPVHAPSDGTSPNWVRLQLQVPFSADYYRGPVDGVIIDDDRGVLVA